MKSALMLVVTLLLATVSLAAQEQKVAAAGSVSEPPSQNVRQSPARETYRLDYTITEMEDGKKVNARTYSVMCEDRGGSTKGGLKVGSRIPVATGPTSPGGGLSTQFTYLDLGVNIDAYLENTSSGELSLTSSIEMSSVADSTSANQVAAPVIRQLKLYSNNAIGIGKPIVISSADDVASHRQFQIQVVATKVK